MCCRKYILFIPVSAIYLLLMAQGKLDHLTDERVQSVLVYVAIPCFVNSVMNPILYSFQIAEVKRAFKDSFCCCRKTNKAEEHNIRSIQHTKTVKETNATISIIHAL